MSPIQKFTFMMNDAEKQALRAQHTRFLQAIDAAFDEFAPQLMVLDELLVAENKGFVPREALEPLLDKWLKTCEVVLTGRDFRLAVGAAQITPPRCASTATPMTRV